MSASDPGDPDALPAALRQELGTALSESAADRAASSRDFGGLVSALPAGVVHARSEDDVVRALRAARAAGTRVAVRGAGHSSAGQSLCADGLVVANCATEPDLVLSSDGRVDVSARTQWAHLETALNQEGRAMPVLTGNGEVTVGGTLSVGGYGLRSVMHGAQVDHVERLRLVRPDGSAVWCADDEHDELLRYSLAGFGQVGVIERAVMRTIPFRERTAYQVVQHGGVDSLVDGLMWLAEPEGGAVQSFAGLHAVGQLTASFYELADDDDVPAQLAAQSPRTVPAGSVSLERTGSTQTGCNLPVDYIVGRDGLRPMLRYLESRWYEGDLPMCMDSFLVLAIRRRAGVRRLPFEAAAFGDEPLLYLVGVYPAFNSADDARIPRVKALLRGALEKCLELGGRPYLYGWHELSAEEKRELYGAEYDRLATLRRELDPDGLLNRGAL